MPTNKVKIEVSLTESLQTYLEKKYFAFKKYVYEHSDYETSVTFDEFVSNEFLITYQLQHDLEINHNQKGCEKYVKKYN